MLFAKKIRHVICFLTVLWLAACGSTQKKDYYQPKDDSEFAACFNLCRNDRFRCRTLVRRELGACDQNYEVSFRIYERCLAAGISRNRCVRPNPCSPPNFQACVSNFDVCFIGCGGRIVTPENGLTPGNDQKKQ